MKKIFFSGMMFLFILQGAFAQKTNRVVKDPQLQRDVLVGKCTRHGLETGIFSSWFNTEYKNYRPDAKMINQIRAGINKVRITIVFGSWCGDSKRQVGRFFKILDEAGYKKEPKLIAVMRSLKAGDVDISDLEIRRIPTFIIYYHGKEAGRIVESPKTTLEKDLLEILKEIK
jgi:thiol-disulfide isomerase/thioredoxin